MVEPGSALFINSSRAIGLVGDWQLLFYLLRRDTQPISVPEEQNAFLLSTRARLNPLTPSRALVHTLQEANGTAFYIRAVVLTHDGLDGFCGFIGVVKGDSRHVMVEDVGLNNAVHKVATDEAELAVNGCSGTASEVPGMRFIVRKAGVGVLEIGDGNLETVSTDAFKI